MLRQNKAWLRSTDANDLPSTEQATKMQPKQGKFFYLVFNRFNPFIFCLSVVLWLDKGDFPENVHIRINRRSLEPIKQRTETCACLERAEH